MVGPPKSLHDLRRIEANLVVTCRACGRVREFDRETLIADLTRRRRSLDWTMLPSHFRCGNDDCRSKDVRLSAPAFADKLRLEQLPELQCFLDAADAVMFAVADMNRSAEALTVVGTRQREFQDAKRALLRWAWAQRERGMR